jgi:DNA-binding MarR family transcriptional regulator
MDTNQFSFTRLQNEILRLLCIKSGEQLNLRGIARELSVSPTAVAKSIKELEKEELIKVDKSKTMNLIFVSLNNNSKTLKFKRVENLKIIYESNFSDFLENHFPNSSTVLYGDYSQGIDTSQSIVNIAIIGSKNKNLDLREFEKKLERKINLEFFNSFKEINKELRQKILNGIVLAGELKL